MEKQKRWQFYLIVAVIVLTIYNILPTIFFYSNPLNQPIDAKRAEAAAHQISERINSLENDSIEWIWSFSKLLGIKPNSVAINQNDRRMIEISFKNQKDAAIFKRLLPNAAKRIPFIPAQLQLYTEKADGNALTVYAARKVGVHLNKDDVKNIFHFSPREENEQISSLYKEITYGRAKELGEQFGSSSLTALQLQQIARTTDTKEKEDQILSFAKEFVEKEKTLSAYPELLKRYRTSFLQTNEKNPSALIIGYKANLNSLIAKLESEKETLSKEEAKAKEDKQFLEASKQSRLLGLGNEIQSLKAASALLEKNSGDLTKASAILAQAEIEKELVAGIPKNFVQKIDLKGKNPFVEALVIDWNSDRIELKFFDDVAAILAKEPKNEAESIAKEKLNQLVINDIATHARKADEEILPFENTFAVNLNELAGMKSFLTLDLQHLAKLQSKQLEKELQSWNRNHIDLSTENYPVHDFESFKKLKPEEQKLGLVIYAPVAEKQAVPEGFQKGSIYVIAKGLNAILEKHAKTASNSESQELVSDVHNLEKLMQLNGFIGYPGSSYGLSPEFSQDYIYELNDYYRDLIAATRENFSVKGDKRYAVLDFSNVEQQILTQNKIDDRIQEDLLKWKEEYDTAQVSLSASDRYEVPAPTKNAYFQNFALSFNKYFRGDDRKVLKWGLDLSGGKTVRIGLKDRNGKTVTENDDLNQAVNELYKRINTMGVSERAIHIESNNIILDFPGSQNMSASELIKASAMYFHIVNEKFGMYNSDLNRAVNTFLQNIWNEAVVTNRKDIDSINQIAWNHLGGNSVNIEAAHPRSESAQILFDNGLRLANPDDKNSSSAFNDTLSIIGMMREDDSANWNGQTHPLLVLFHNFALEGSNLTGVQVGYEPTKGNILSFNVKKTSDAKNGENPRETLYAWTSQFSHDKISGTPREHYSKGRGWRMAVVLNGTVITQPELQAALNDGGSINGRFSQREISQLAADLKAGSLSFTPKILSEENVSPELGKEERTRGIAASIVALALVVLAMCGYYRFAGFIASCAVLFNILIMWGILQNLDAAITLPGIAGIVLTIGMAVDANVLVFERIREEFKISGRIASAIAAGYKKAFSAIFDSNITTIIAALILIQFDSGPIKGFAVTLIIGIVSSMFTALFMTRYFFAGWVQNPKNKALHMSQLIGKTHFNFLKQTKKALGISMLIIAIGSYFFATQGKSMLGMDFTGGYSLNVELAEKAAETNYRLQAADALLAKGASSNDFQIRELNRPNQLRIQLGTSMEEKDHPFYHMPETETEGKYAHSYESNPRIVWLVNALNDNGLTIAPNELDSLDANWSVISGQFSDTMRNNALIGLALALFMILLYITFRFEFKFAIAAVVGLIYDVVITMGILAILHYMGLSVQIDLQVIGAIMTIIGYSLNDTIIVFDRIREDMDILRKLSFKEIINHALNVTLSRTLMTSGTTLLVLLALVFLGGKSIFAFSLVMTIGVIVGTLSTLFIAAPALLYFHNREIAQEKDLKKA